MPLQQMTHISFILLLDDQQHYSYKEILACVSLRGLYLGKMRKGLWTKKNPRKNNGSGGKQAWVVALKEWLRMVLPQASRLCTGGCGGGLERERGVVQAVTFFVVPCSTHACFCLHPLYYWESIISLSVSRQNCWFLFLFSFFVPNTHLYLTHFQRNYR